MISLVAIALTLSTQHRVRGLEQELVKRQQDSQGQATEAHILAKQAQDSSREAAAKVALLEARLGEVSMQRGQLDDVIQQLSRSRDENMVVDIDAAIRVAQQQMMITGSAEPLITTLRQADERLARSSQPRLDVVRRAIARDLDRVRSVGAVNISSLSIKLDEAVRLVDELPLLSNPEVRADAQPASTTSGGRSSQRSASVPPAAPVASQPVGSMVGWIDIWNGFANRIWTEARGLVRVTRIDHPEAMLLAPENGFFLRENLKLRLLNARLGVLSRQFDTAQTDLQQVQSSLERYFDRGSRKVVLAQEAVRQVALQARQVNLPRPDETLAALAALATVR